MHITLDGLVLASLFGPLIMDLVRKRTPPSISNIVLDMTDGRYICPEFCSLRITYTLNWLCGIFNSLQYRSTQSVNLVLLGLQSDMLFLLFAGSSFISKMQCNMGYVWAAGDTYMYFWEYEVCLVIFCPVNMFMDRCVFWISERH